MKGDTVLLFFGGVGNLFNVCFNRGQLPSHICFHIQFVLTYCFGQNIWWKFGLSQICSWTSKKFNMLLTTFSVNYGFSLTLHQNSTSGSLLIIYIVEIWHCINEFHTLTLKPSIYNLNGSFIYHDFVMSCIGHLENIGLLSDVDLPNVDTFLSSISKQSYSLMTLPISSVN